MNKYIVLERQEEKVIRLEEEKRLIAEDVRKADSEEDFQKTEKRIRSLRRKRDYLTKQVMENYHKNLGSNANLKVHNLIGRLHFLIQKRGTSYKANKTQGEKDGS